MGGNHEEFGGAAHFEEAIRSAGIQVLHNECETVDGVRIVGVAYGPSAYPLHQRAFLEGLELKKGPPSILLSHVPNKLPIAEHAGVSLQLSGHTHGGGQIFPFNFITRRAFGKFTYGLQRFGEMQVYTSSGAGTWDPPMRVGTYSEISNRSEIVSIRRDSNMADSSRRSSVIVASMAVIASHGRTLPKRLIMFNLQTEKFPISDRKRCNLSVKTGHLTLSASVTDA